MHGLRFRHITIITLPVDYCVTSDAFRARDAVGSSRMFGRHLGSLLIISDFLFS